MGVNLRRVTSQASAAAASVSVGARIGRDGRFEFPNVPPGQYIIKADRGRRSPSTEGEFGALPVSVDGADITGLILQASAGSTIAGRVTFESVRGIQAPRTSQIQIQPVPVDRISHRRNRPTRRYTTTGASISRASTAHADCVCFALPRDGR
jgi:hypothetical protein